MPVVGAKLSVPAGDRIRFTSVLLPRRPLPWIDHGVLISAIRRCSRASSQLVAGKAPAHWQRVGTMKGEAGSSWSLPTMAKKALLAQPCRTRITDPDPGMTC
jgi:hypothetical protein